MGKILIDIARAFLFLGLTSFGGPAAHIARFEQTFVRQRGWLSAEAFQQLVAQAHLLPGPSSSQVGFAIGVSRAGIAGGITAFIAFTLPSAVLMLLLATQLVHLSGFASAAALIHGLKLFAVAVVADAVLSMARNFCQTNRAKSLALLACGLTLLQWPAYAVIAIAAVMIVVISRAFPVNRQDRTEPQPAEKPVIQPQADNVWRQSAGWLLLWGLLLLMALAGSGLLWAGFYRSGSLVFGGGHVVLPLLQQTFATQLAADSLLTGYAAAQVMPGPMFTLATYLGAILSPDAPVSGALVATAAIFLPGFLLMLAITPLWRQLSAWPPAAVVVPAINAAVTGLLLATLVASSSLLSGADTVFVIAGFIALRRKALNVIGLITLALGFALLA